MFTSETVNVLTFFYPIGNTPAVSLTQALPPQDPADILLLGCGDLRNVLFTAHVDGRPLDITTCDVQKAIIARNVLLLTLIIDDVDGTRTDLMWKIYYHMRFDKAADDILRAQAKKLVTISATITAWQQSRYGSQLKFCDTATLADARTMWSFYSKNGEDPQAGTTEKRLRTVVDLAEKMKKTKQSGVVITGFRAAVPAHCGSFGDMDALHKHFWRTGTVDLEGSALAKAKLPNPMFLTFDDPGSLHYGTDPFQGFHLAEAYLPQSSIIRRGEHTIATGATILKKLVETAREEFRSWTASFRKHAGSITLRFFIGDAIALAHTLQYARASGSPTAGFYRERYLLQPLILLDADYNATGSAPSTFDVVDTSNLCDHLGALNLLTAVSPLLRNKLASTLYTETFRKTSKRRSEVLDTMLCGDTPTMTTLLALFPVEYWTNAACVSYGDEALVDDIMQGESTGQMFLRIAWKRPPCPTLFGATDLDLAPIHFAEPDLVNVLYKIYVRMFVDEDYAKKFEILRLSPENGLDPQPHYHRAGLAAFLRLVKTRVICNWDMMMGMFVNLAVNRPNAPMGGHYFQELFTYLHLLDVYTVDVLEDASSIPGMSIALAGGQGLRAWSDIPPIVCLTLKVPRKYLKALTKLDFGTPAVHCKVAGGPTWENLFSACQFSFGATSTKGTQHSSDFEVTVTEDKRGWRGSSPLVVTFYTPSWAIVRDYHTAAVSFGLHSTPKVQNHFMKDYGPFLMIFETAITNAENVFITKYAPQSHGFPKSPGLTLDRMPSANDNSDPSEQTMTEGVHTQTGRIMTMTGRISIHSKKHQAALKDGAPVVVGSSTPCRTTVTLGQEQPLDLNFPVPVLATDQKIRIARKSSYVEIIAQVATASQSAEFATSFVYPLYLTGEKQVPLAYSMSHVNLQKQPVLHPDQLGKLVWLNAHFSMQMSNRERVIRDIQSVPRTPGERVRFEFKEGLFSLLVQFAGLQGPKRSLFGISNLNNGGVHILVFPNKLRIDLATRTVVLDCAVLPLHKGIVPKIDKFVSGLLPLGIVQIKVDDAELGMWKQVLPAWVERCRTDWTHGEECEYRVTGKIPLTDQHNDAQFLCSCGQDVFPDDFELPDVPKWVAMAKQYSTRAAISPVFWAPFADEVFMPPIGDDRKPSGGCGVCGLKQQKDGGLLMRCGKCRVAQYCSAECQRTDWKTHKSVCSGMRT